MNRILNIFLIVVLGALIYVGVSNAIDNHNHAERHKVQPVDIQSIVPARYVPVMPFEGPDFTTAAENTIHAVVHIRSEFPGKTNIYNDFFRDFFGEPGTDPNRTYSGFGSGVIISEDGYIVTNNHVVEGAGYVEVTLNNKHKYEAELIGRDPTTDLALIKIEAENLSYLTYGNSDDVKIGEWVIAVGNPFNLTSTVTAGIVSAKARGLNILGIPGAIESFIQTDAAVNRGNSGGALANTKGELIGINAAIASQTGLYTGYSFAIPVNIVRKVMDDLMMYGKVQRAFIGVIIREVNSDLAQVKGLEEIRGVYIERLSENGGARESGIIEGDVIVGVDGIEVNSTAQLLEIVAQHSPGDLVFVDIIRNGTKQRYNVELKDDQGTATITRKEDSFHAPDLGVTLGQIPESEMNKLHITYGMKITDLDDGMLRNGGVKNGFIIQEINNIKIRSKEDVDFAMKNIKGGVIRIKGIYPNGMKMNYGFVL